MDLTLPLPKCFGDGSPGWLLRDVAPDTFFDFAEGKVEGRQGRFVRSEESRRWARAH